jgi:mannose-1-phosphate guanylyltransferase
VTGGVVLRAWRLRLGPTIGDFAALALWSLPDGPVRVLGEPGPVAAVDASGLVVTRVRAVALLGVATWLVVDYRDALLVTTEEHAQQVRAPVNGGAGPGGDDLL